MVTKSKLNMFRGMKKLKRFSNFIVDSFMIHRQMI